MRVLAYLLNLFNFGINYCVVYVQNASRQLTFMEIYMLIFTIRFILLVCNDY